MSLYFRIKEWLWEEYGLRFYRHGTPLGLDLGNDLRVVAPKFAPRVVFDVGGNVGQTVRRFSTIWPKAKIYSFEPVKSTYDQLAATAKTLDREIRTYHVALSDHAGTGEIYLSHSSQLASLERPANSTNSSSGQCETIQLDTLDAFCNANAVGHIDFLKIDTEGHDLSVLRGGAHLIENGHVDAVFVETRVTEMEYESSEEILRWLVPRGFQMIAFYDQQVWLARKLLYGNSLFLHSRILDLSP